jgi:plastocyanin
VGGFDPDQGKGVDDLTARRRSKLALVAVTTLTLALAACGDDGGGGASATCPKGAVTIAMKGQSFEPSTATAKVGQEICWQNESLFIHDVVAEPCADFKSRQYNEGEKRSP